MTGFLQFHEISKTFPGVRALDRVSLRIREGTVHGLVGENGAGKSTLLKILSGAQPPTSGSIVFDGKPVEFAGPGEAIAAGVAVIYQELNLVPDMTVAENLLLGHIPNRGGFLSKEDTVERANRMLEYLGEEVGPNVKVKKLPIGQRQMIEIGKALLHNAKIIAFDEPTSSLSDTETRRLFRIIRTLRESGRAIIYVSHRLNEIFELCDELTVFRDGRLIETFEYMGDVTHDLVVSRMVGREITDIYGYRPRKTGDVAIEVRDIVGPGVTEPTSFSVRKGEVVGFFGLVGAGRSELMRMVFGLVTPDTGTIYVNGERVLVDGPEKALQLGIALCPEDRKYEGVIPIRNVCENINASIRRRYARYGFFLDHRRERENALSFVDKLQIKTPSIRQLVGNLSGGNQQKIVLARNLSMDTTVMILDEPTRGIDVGTKSEIYRLIYELTEMGNAVIVVSSELPEIIGISDRIIVMCKGKIVAEVLRAEATEEVVLGHALSGHTDYEHVLSETGVMT